MACSRLYLRTVTTFNATAPVSDIPRPTSLPPGTCLALHVPSQWPRAPCGPKCPREETTSKRHVGTPTNVSGDSSPSPLPGRSICMFKRARRPSQTCFLYAMPCETCGPRRQCGRGQMLPHGLLPSTYVLEEMAAGTMAGASGHRAPMLSS